MNRNLRSALIALIALASLGCFLFLAWFLFATPPTSGQSAPDTPGLPVAQLPPTETAPAPAPPPTLAAIPDPPTSPPPPWSRGHILDVSKNPDFATLPSTPITLNLDNAPPQEVLSAFYRALSIPLPTNGRGPTFFGGRTPISLHLQETPLLDAILQFSALTNAPLRNLSPQLLEYAPVMPVTSPGGDQDAVGVWCLTGPFAIVLERIDNHISFPAGNDPANSCMLTMTILAEPNLNILLYPQRFLIDTFLDDGNQPLTLGPPEFPTPNTNRTPSTLRMPLKLSASRGRRIALFRGAAPFILAKEFVPFDTSLPTGESVTRNVGGMKVELSSGLEPGQRIPRYTFHFSQSGMGADVWRSIAPTLIALPVQAFGGNVGASPPFFSPAVVQPDGSILLSFTLGRSNTALPAADRIVANIPTAVRELNVPFEFKDILLP